MSRQIQTRIATSGTNQGRNVLKRVLFFDFALHDPIAHPSSGFHDKHERRLPPGNGDRKYPSAAVVADAPRLAHGPQILGDSRQLQAPDMNPASGDVYSPVSYLSGQTGKIERRSLAGIRPIAYSFPRTAAFTE
jgi:hypothetical protein